MTDVARALFSAVSAALAHPGVPAVARGLEAVVRFGCRPSPDGEAVGAVDIVAGASGLAARPADPARMPDVAVLADAGAWRRALSDPPPPLYQSFSAWQLRNEAFTVSGEPLAIAQCRALLEAVVEHWHPGAPMAVDGPSLEGLVGRYHRVRGPGGRVADIFVESAGEGEPLLCLHTAGADSRQYHELMAGISQAASWRAMAFDMPAHGRSMPHRAWEGEAYALAQADYVGWCVAVIEQVIGRPATLLGCSMGAAIALAIAAQRPDLVRAAIALEAPVRPRGRRNPFLTHARVHAGWHTAAYVRGLMSPMSPLGQRRRAAWIYAQGGPGVYDGDLRFYSDEFDGEAIARAIDGRRIPVVLMTGRYDFSATVEDAVALAGWIEGARLVEMPELGHFPMTENPPLLLSYLLPELERLSG